MLQTSGFAIKTWPSGSAFLKEVQNAAPGCVLLDVRMPEISGLDVQQMLVNRGITMPIIMMIGHGDVSIAIKAKEGGALDFIEKPFEKNVLLASVEAAFAAVSAVCGKSGPRNLSENTA